MLPLVRKQIRAFYSSYSCLLSPLSTPYNSISLPFHCHSSSSVASSELSKAPTICQDQSHIVDAIISKIPIGSSYSEILDSLVHNEACKTMPITKVLVDMLLFRFKDDWKSALGIFRWTASRMGCKHTPEAHDMMIDILGRSRKSEQMRAFLVEMKEARLVSMNTVGKAMRRFARMGEFEQTIALFDRLEAYGLEKNTESMNLLFDTLCKEERVKQARGIFLELKPHISPNAKTFNIFIHGWCKINYVDEAYWTIQEMKGYGFDPCVISYSTLMQFYCQQRNFTKVFELLDEMESNGNVPNAITYTTIMCSLTKMNNFKDALKIPQRMKSIGCKPDTLFCNSLLHTLGKAGLYQEAIRVFETEMPHLNIPPDTSTYNTMIGMFCRRSQDRMAINLLNAMGSSDICKPDLESYCPLFKLCFKRRRYDLVEQFLDEMINRHHLCLDIATFTLLIHGFCKLDNFKWAYRLFKDMCGQEITPRWETCRLLLEGLRKHNMLDASKDVEFLLRDFKSRNYV